MNSSGFFNRDGSCRPRSSRGSKENSGGGRASWDMWSWQDGAGGGRPATARSSLSSEALANARTQWQSPGSQTARSAGVSSRSAIYTGGSIVRNMHHGGGGGGGSPMSFSKPGFSRRLADSQGHDVISAGNGGSAVSGTLSERPKTSDKKREELYSSVNIFNGSPKTKTESNTRYHQVCDAKVKDIGGSIQLAPGGAYAAELAAAEVASAAVRKAARGGMESPLLSARSKAKGVSPVKTCSPEEARTARVHKPWNYGPGGKDSISFGTSEKPSTASYYGGFSTSRNRQPPGGASTLSLG